MKKIFTYNWLAGLSNYQGFVIPTLRFLSLYLIIVISCFSCDGLVSNRLSRESSQDILVEDIDRLSTTSAMSESSVSHRLNDVQDVQDIARMQEESE